MRCSPTVLSTEVAFPFFPFSPLLSSIPLLSLLLTSSPGVSRCAYKVDTIGEGAVISYYLGQYSSVLVATLVAVSAVGHWVVTGQVTFW